METERIKSGLNAAAIMLAGVLFFVLGFGMKFIALFTDPKSKRPGRIKKVVESGGELC